MVQTPFGWTLELCLILWVWIVFFGCAFIVREKDHVTFDILYLAVPRRILQVLALIAAVSIAVGMIISFLPTWDYIDFLRLRGTSTVRLPITGDKIAIKWLFAAYILLMVATILRYLWRVYTIARHGPPETELEELLSDTADREDAS